ncbi:integrin alpha [Myxococcota bacterium]|nr:integrin alpha [Myxococcota bacterium]
METRATRRTHPARALVVAGVGLAVGCVTADVPGAAWETLGVQADPAAAPLGEAAAWTAEADQVSAYFGYSLAGAGDVDGDGYVDLVVGAYKYDGGATDEGMAFLFRGGPDGPAPAPSWTAGSGQSYAGAGYSVAAAGDVNGDGFDDVVVGTLQYDGGNTNEGRAELYLGSAAGLSAAPAWTAEGDQTSAAFGADVAGAGDVNGDGYDDVAVGAWGYDGGETDEGRAFLFLGAASGLSESAAWTAESDQASAYFGAAVAGAGDVNGDGYADVVVGAYSWDGDLGGEGRAYLYLGSAAGLEGAPAWTATSDQAWARFGYAVAGAGDVNGDGYDDVVVGAPNDDDGVYGEGRVYLYLGSASGLGGAPAWAAASGEYAAWLGKDVAGAGDVNGDGYGDVLAGAYGYDGAETDQGRAYLYLGSAGGLGAAPAWTMDGDQAQGYFGFSVAGAGDVNADGFADVAVGAYGYDAGESNEGRAYAYLGADDGGGAADCSASALGPAEGADLTEGATFIWSGDCAGYRVEVSADPGFPANASYLFGSFADAAGDNAFAPSATIWSAIGARFTEAGYWRVVGGLDGAKREFDARSFHTELPAAPPAPAPVEGCTVELDSPAEGGVLGSPPTFTWTTDCTGAYLELSTDPGFAVEATYSFGSVSWGRYGVSETVWGSLDGRFAMAGIGYWRVIAGAAEGPVASDARTFTVP